MRIKWGSGSRLTMGILLLLGGVTWAVGRHTVAEVRAGVQFGMTVAAAILLHELGHVIAARLCGVRLGELRISLFGARLGLSGVLSYRRECFIAAAGPAVNLLSAAVILLPAIRRGENLAENLAEENAAAVFALASLGLAAINLLPVRSLDGGRMLHCLVASTLGVRAADAAVTVGTALCLGGMWCFSVYALLRVGEMLSLFAFSFCLLLRMTGE